MNDSPKPWRWLMSRGSPWRLGDTGCLTFAKGLDVEQLFNAFGFAGTPFHHLKADEAERQMSDEDPEHGPFWLRVASVPGWAIGIETYAQKGYLDGLASSASSSSQAVMVAVNGKSFGVFEHWRRRELAASFMINNGPIVVRGTDPVPIEEGLAAVGLLGSSPEVELQYARQIELVLDMITEHFDVVLTEAEYLAPLPTATRTAPFHFPPDPNMS